MTLPVIGAIGGLSLNAATAATPPSAGSLAQQAGGLAGEGLAGLGVEPSTASASTSTQSVQGIAPSEAAAGGEGAGASGSGGFGSALTEAISSLEGGQLKADSAAQSLATGTVKDPESAVATVEDAALSMQLAAQLRTKATEAVQTIFSTQV